jgi:hypothetical protein
MLILRGSAVLLVISCQVPCFPRPTSLQSLRCFLHSGQIIAPPHTLKSPKIETIKINNQLTTVNYRTFNVRTNPVQWYKSRHSFNCENSPEREMKSQPLEPSMVLASETAELWWRPLIKNAGESYFSHTQPFFPEA